jgi:hypothetical protein
VLQNEGFEAVAFEALAFEALAFKALAFEALAFEATVCTLASRVKNGKTSN